MLLSVDQLSLLPSLDPLLKLLAHPLLTLITPPRPFKAQQSPSKLFIFLSFLTQILSGTVTENLFFHCTWELSKFAIHLLISHLQPTL